MEAPCLLRMLRMGLTMPEGSTDTREAAGPAAGSSRRGAGQERRPGIALAIMLSAQLMIILDANIYVGNTNLHRPYGEQPPEAASGRQRTPRGLPFGF